MAEEETRGGTQFVAYSWCGCWFRWFRWCRWCCCHDVAVITAMLPSSRSQPSLLLFNLRRVTGRKGGGCQEKGGRRPRKRRGEGAERRGEEGLRRSARNLRGDEAVSAPAFSVLPVKKEACTGDMRGDMPVNDAGAAAGGRADVARLDV